MTSILDRCEEFGITFDRKVHKADEIQQFLIEAKRERSEMDNYGENTDVFDIAIGKIEAELASALEKIYDEDGE